MAAESDLCVIVNPRAGRVDRSRALLAELASLAGEGFHRTRAPGDATVLAGEAASRGCGRLVIAGGDGTIQEVVNGLPESGPAPVLGLLPLGTGNDLCRGLGLPLDARAALEVVRYGRPRPLDLIGATIDRGSGERRLVNFALGGFAGDIPRHVTAARRRRWGRAVYLRATLAALGQLRSYRTRLVVEGRPLPEKDLLALVIANGPVLGCGIPVAPPADPSDGVLDLVAVRAVPGWRVPTLLARVLTGRHLSGRSACHLRARSVEVEADPPMPFNGDGQPLGRDPARFRVRPGAVRYLAPPPRATEVGEPLSKERSRRWGASDRGRTPGRTPERTGGRG